MCINPSNKSQFRFRWFFYDPVIITHTILKEMLKLAERAFIGENCDFISSVIKQFYHRVSGFEMNRFKYSYLHCFFVLLPIILKPKSSEVVTFTELISFVEPTC